MGRTISRRYARDDIDPSGMPPAGNMDKLGGVLKAAGLMDDDIMHILELISSEEAVDAAPPASSQDPTNYSQYGGGGTYDPDTDYSGRSYTPTDSGGSANDRRRAMDARHMATDAAAHVARVMATRHQRYEARQITYDQLHAPVAPLPRVMSAADQKWHKEQFPHADRLL